MAICYFKGEYIDEAAASLSIHLLGAQRGFGIFDFLRSRDRKPTFLNDHIERFNRSQKFLNLSQEIPTDEILEAVSQLQKRNGHSHSSFKLMLFGDGDESQNVLDPFFYIVNAPLAPDLASKESNLISFEYLREYPKIKSVNYITSNVLHNKKKEAKAVDVLYQKDGVITETSRSNVFIIRDDILFTPDKNMLEGITRKHVLKVAAVVMKTELKQLSIADVLSADEVFITSTLKEIMPIVNLDGSSVGNGEKGSWTEKLQGLFTEYLAVN